MRIINNLLESDETNETTYWFLSQTAKQNKWGRCTYSQKYANSPLRKSLKRKRIHSEAKTKPSRNAHSLHRVEAQRTTCGKIIDVFLLHVVRKQNMCRGQPALHTTDRITPGVFWLHPNRVRLHFYHAHKHRIQWTDQSSRWGTSTETILKTTYSSYWKSYSQTTTSHLTTNFTTKLSEPPWPRSHHLKYVTHGSPHKNKSKFMPASEMMGSWHGRRHLLIM